MFRFLQLIINVPKVEKHFCDAISYPVTSQLIRTIQIIKKMCLCFRFIVTTIRSTNLIMNPDRTNPAGLRFDPKTTLIPGNAHFFAESTKKSQPQLSENISHLILVTVKINSLATGILFRGQVHLDKVALVGLG